MKFGRQQSLLLKVGTRCLYEIFAGLATSDGQKALHELHEDYFIPLLRFVKAMVQTKEVAEEIVHDVFINLWKKRDSLPAIDNPELYLYQCARNGALAYCRTQTRRATGFKNYVQDIKLRWSRNPEELLISSEMVQYINQAIDQLPPKCKLIFLLVKETGLKYREVADLLDISVKTVEAQMSIALKKINYSIHFDLA